MVKADGSWSAGVLIAAAAHAARMGSGRSAFTITAFDRTGVVHGNVVNTRFFLTPVSTPGVRGETAALLRLAATF